MLDFCKELCSAIDILFDNFMSFFYSYTKIFQNNKNCDFYRFLQRLGMNKKFTILNSFSRHENHKIMS